MCFLKHMSLIYWVGNTKTDAELVLPKHGILSLPPPFFFQKEFIVNNKQIKITNQPHTLKKPSTIFWKSQFEEPHKI